jgi:sarcosine oxidase subunit beta
VANEKVADVIVVGAGVVGCSLAFHLVRAGLRVRIFDKGEICGGMSARSGALIRMHYTYPPEAVLAWKSLSYFQNWSEIVGGHCGFVKTGFSILVGGENADRLRANTTMLRSLGINTYVLDGAELKNIDSGVKTDGVALAAYEPDSGYADPIATTKSFAEAAERLGATFRTNAAIAGISVRGGRATGVIDLQGNFHESGKVCIVTGPWTDQLLRSVGAQIGIKMERSQIAFFRRPAALRHCAYIDTVNGIYLRPHGPDSTLVGTAESEVQVEANPDHFSESNDRKFINSVRDKLIKRIPGMASAPYVTGHAGIYDMTPDSRPVLGPVPEVPDLYVAAGFSGTGFKTAPAVGAALAKWITTGPSAAGDLLPFGFERLRSGRIIKSENEYEIAETFGHKI